MLRLAILLFFLTSCAPAAAQAPVVASGSGNGNTAPFALSGGNYKVDWTLADNRATSILGCNHGTRLVSTTEQRSYQLGTGTVAQGEKTASGTTYAYGVSAGTYYLAVMARSDCDWSFTLTPQ